MNLLVPDILGHLAVAVAVALWRILVYNPRLVRLRARWSHYTKSLVTAQSIEI